MYTIVPGGAQPHDITILSNEFLDVHMPRANGEFVKIYLCFVRLLQGNRKGEVAASDIADRLACTEGDVIRALRYWEGEGLLSFSGEKPAVSSSPEAAPDAPRRKGAIPASAPSAEVSEIPEGPSRERFEELEGQEEVQNLNFIAEQYFRRTLTRKDLEAVAFCYDSLHFSYELIDYLLEYCANQGKTSPRYVETVALQWHGEGIQTAEAARGASELYQKKQKQYFEILRALGISGRSPIAREKEIMDRWLVTYSLPMELIAEACERTVLATSRPTLAYAGKILEKWHKAGIRTPDELERFDAANPRAKEQPAPRSPRIKNGVGNFGAYDQRNFDYRKAEAILCGYETAESGEGENQE